MVVVGVLDSKQIGEGMDKEEKCVMSFQSLSRMKKTSMWKRQTGWGAGAQVNLRKASVLLWGLESCWKMVCIQGIDHISKYIKDN